MPLLKAGQPVDDVYAEIADDAPIPNTPALVPFSRLAEIPLGRNAPLGVRLPSTTPHDVLEQVARRATLIAIEFPIFRDGRGFTLARTLREYHGFTGEIRAVGHILPDQYAFLIRCGFSTVRTKGDDLGPWQAALTRFHKRYQPAVGDTAKG
jgi:uncharacterized protein (DUF934 family)